MDVEKLKIPYTNINNKNYFMVIIFIIILSLGISYYFIISSKNKEKCLINQYVNNKQCQNCPIGKVNNKLDRKNGGNTYVLIKYAMKMNMFLIIIVYHVLLEK